MTANGELLVVYAIPLNEPRGVYMVRSADLGATWSRPVRVFDGAAAGWEGWEISQRSDC